MKKIKLTQGKEALLDDEDFDRVSNYKWYCSIEPNNNYALTRMVVEGKSKLVRMHRFILGLNDSKILVDHKDNDGLNNTRGNLRIATSKENLRNKRKGENLTSKYKGVHRALVYSFYKSKKYEYVYWIASITIDSKSKQIGAFKYDDNGEIEAAKAYDRFAKKYFLEFANLNFK